MFDAAENFNAREKTMVYFDQLRRRLRER